MLTGVLIIRKIDFGEKEVDPSKNNGEDIQNNDKVSSQDQKVVEKKKTALYVENKKCNCFCCILILFLKDTYLIIFNYIVKSFDLKNN